MKQILLIIFVPIIAVIIAFAWCIDTFMMHLRDMNTCKECGYTDRFWFYFCSPLLIISFIGMGLCRVLERLGY